MAKTLAGVLAVSIASLLFAGCGGGDSKWTDSKCAEVWQKLSPYSSSTDQFIGSGAKTKAIALKQVQVLVEDAKAAEKFAAENPGISEEFQENCDAV